MTLRCSHHFHHYCSLFLEHLWAALFGELHIACYPYLIAGSRSVVAVVRRSSARAASSPAPASAPAFSFVPAPVLPSAPVRCTITMALVRVHWDQEHAC